MKQMKSWLQKVTIYDFQKILGFIIILLYIPLYMYAFDDFQAICSECELDDFEWGMSVIIRIIGVSLALAIMIFALLKSKSKIWTRLLSVVLVVIQILYLGVPGSELQELLRIKNFVQKYNSYAIYVNVKQWIKENKEFALLHGDEVSAMHCERGVNFIFAIEVCLAILAVLIICGLILEVIRRKKGIEGLKVDGPQNINIEVKKVDILTRIFQCCNVFIVLFLVELIGKYIISGPFVLEVFEMDEGYLAQLDVACLIEESLENIKGILLPLCTFLILIVNWLIKKKRYECVALAYYFYRAMYISSMYHIHRCYIVGYESINNINDFDGWATKYLLCIDNFIKMFMVIAIVNWLWIIVKTIYKKTKGGCETINKEEFGEKKKSIRWKIFIVVEVLLILIVATVILKSTLDNYATIEVTENMLININIRFNEFIKAYKDWVKVILIPIVICSMVGIYIVNMLWEKKKC